MDPVDALVCRRCGRRYAPTDVTYTCPDHDGVDGVLDVRYDYDVVRARIDAGSGGKRDGHRADLWEFEPFLPVDGDYPVRLGAGGTDLLSAPALSERLGVSTRVKDETSNPTGSTKDRGTAVVVTRARERGHDVVTCASTGNAAASLAGYAARAGLDCRIFVPEDVPEAKAVQPRLYGADVLAVDGSYADAYELCRRASAERGWYSRNAAMNPYAVEGKRTLGFELAEQAPDADWVALPMGNGGTLAAVWKGLAEYRRLGRLENPPRMLGVQAAGATAICDAFGGRERGRDADEDPNATGANDDRTATEATDRRNSSDGSTERPSENRPGDEAATGTVADSIDVATPHNAGKACEALRESGGDVAVVDDDAILRAQRLLGETEGVFVEPASAAAVAGVAAARDDGPITADDEVVVVATGTGLKDTAAARAAVDDVTRIDASLESLPDGT